MFVDVNSRLFIIIVVAKCLFIICDDVLVHVSLYGFCLVMCFTCVGNYE